MDCPGIQKAFGLETELHVPQIFSPDTHLKDIPALTPPPLPLPPPPPPSPSYSPLSSPPHPATFPPFLLHPVGSHCASIWCRHFHQRRTAPSPAHVNCSSSSGTFTSAIMHLHRRKMFVVILVVVHSHQRSRTVTSDVKDVVVETCLRGPDQEMQGLGL